MQRVPTVVGILIPTAYLASLSPVGMELAGLRYAPINYNMSELHAGSRLRRDSDSDDVLSTHR
jgi:hypothetical protein